MLNSKWFHGCSLSDLSAPTRSTTTVGDGERRPWSGLLLLLALLHACTCCCVAA